MSFGHVCSAVVALVLSVAAAAAVAAQRPLVPRVSEAEKVYVACQAGEGPDFLPEPLDGRGARGTAPDLARLIQ